MYSNYCECTFRVPLQMRFEEQPVSIVSITFQKEVSPLDVVFQTILQIKY